MAAQKKTKSASGSRKKAPSRAAKVQPRRREIWGAICAVLAIISVLAWFDLGAFFTDFIARLGKGLIGTGFYILPFSLGLSAVILFFHDGRPVALRVTCAMLLSVSIGALAHIFAATQIPAWGFADMFRELYLGGIEETCGGAVSGLIAMAISAAISNIGAAIFLILLFLFELLTAFNMTISGIVDAIRQRPRAEYDAPKKEHKDPAKVIVDHVAQKHIEHAAEKRRSRPEDIDLPVDDPIYPQQEPIKPQPQSRVKSPDQLLIEQREAERKKAEAQREQAQEADQPLPGEPEKINREDVVRETREVAKEIEAQSEETAPAYRFPPLDLLTSSSGSLVDGTEEMRINTARLNDTLSSFGIDARIINVIRGPAVTRYELELDRGVKLSKVTNLADDIALQLGAQGVRISAIPDKISVVGIEVPNKAVSVVTLRDVLSSDSFRTGKSAINFAVGKDISGNCIVGDIGKLPHLLIGGTTGSGKSVCMNSLIISLLYKSSPEQVRLIMIDPKMVELGVYNGIPHLLIPVVTDPKKAAGSLQWAVWEMMRRYRLMANAGVRELDSYNKEAAHSEELETLPQVVVVIDELADLMLVAAKEVEESICRIAQMGRAAGIHLVIATQRPSADVITGLMKANIPSRIAFAVATALESRIILDSQGAEKLVGKGDMLYAPLGQGKPKRVQGCFVSDSEVQKVVNFIGKDSTANYDNSVIEHIEKSAAQAGKSSGAAAASESEGAATDLDELFFDAVDVVLET